MLVTQIGEAPVPICRSVLPSTTSVTTTTTVTPEQEMRSVCGILRNLGTRFSGPNQTRERGGRGGMEGEREGGREGCHSALRHLTLRL